jgi:hypothetical protein
VAALWHRQQRREWYLVLRVSAVLCLMVAGELVSQAWLSSDPAQQDGRYMTVSVLSAAQHQVIRRLMAVLPDNGDQGMAWQWHDARQVAVWLCRPALMPAIRRQAGYQTADQLYVSLGSDDLWLQGSVRLTGQGQVHTTERGWQRFDFHCELDPERGGVKAVTVLPGRPATEEAVYPATPARAVPGGGHVP